MDAFYLWHEICDTTRENIHFLKNETTYFRHLFYVNNIENLHTITKSFEDKLSEIELLYELLEINIDRSLEKGEGNYYLYRKLMNLKQEIRLFSHRLKYLTYSIFDTNLKKRIEHIEIMKNHEVTRNLCQYFSTKIKTDSEVVLESHLGYDSDYYCVYGYSSNQGIINSPRNYLFFTRLLSINCHESAHPIIYQKWNEIINDECFKTLYQATENYINEHILSAKDKIINANLTDIQIKKVIDDVFSEIMADLISICVCGKAYLFATISIFLQPRDFMNAKYWLGTPWRTHPPNYLRFNLMIEVVEYLKSADFVAIQSNWEILENLESNYGSDKFNRFLYKTADTFFDEINIPMLIERFRSPDSPIQLEFADIVNTKIDNIDSSSEPINILNSIWNTRINRYEKTPELSMRESSHVLHTLYQSLLWRKQK